MNFTWPSEPIHFPHKVIKSDRIPNDFQGLAWFAMAKCPDCGDVADFVLLVDEQLLDLYRGGEATFIQAEMNGMARMVEDSHHSNRPDCPSTLMCATCQAEKRRAERGVPSN